MANKFVTAIFGDYSKHEVKKLRKTVDKINALEEKYKSMDDKELAAQTPVLKERLANGETLDDILPDAFAVCREASSVFSVCVTLMFSLSAVSFFIRAELPK